MARLRLDIAYDGTDFKGWAAQPGLRTVQGEIEAALTTVLRRAETNPVQVVVGGRTDAGVHARGQVAHFDVADSELNVLFKPQDSIFRQANRLNGVLQRRGSEDVLVTGLQVIDEVFDARFGALWRRYEYRVAGPQLEPLARRFTATIKRQPDIEMLQQAAAELTGLRNFGAFCKAKPGGTTIRNLTEFSWRQEQEVCIAHIQADAFCHSMVRALVGACVAVATGRITLQRLLEIRDNATRSSEFTVMPAHGLSLEEIAYPQSTAELAARVTQTRARRDPLQPANCMVGDLLPNPEFH